MQRAASKFVGEHDFRNFCKMDAANVSNYRRRITEFTISACGKRLNLHFSLLFGSQYPATPSKNA
jgi:tRNA pseudouridine38/39 synthase